MATAVATMAHTEAVEGALDSSGRGHLASVWVRVDQRVREERGSVRGAPAAFTQRLTDSRRPRPSSARLPRSAGPPAAHQHVHPALPPSRNSVNFSIPSHKEILP